MPTTHLYLVVLVDQDCLYLPLLLFALLPLYFVCVDEVESSKDELFLLPYKLNLVSTYIRCLAYAHTLS